jgi:hypothetical protein
MKSPYSDLPEECFWRPAVAQRHSTEWRDVAGPLEGIRYDSSFAAAGSCFAQHVGRALKGSGYPFLDYEQAPADLSPDDARRFGYGIFSARYGNIYSSLQMMQLAQEALQRQEQPRLAIWSTESHLVDGLRPGVMPIGQSDAQQILNDRIAHLKAVRQVLTDCDVFIFTLGLTEIWTIELDGESVAVPSAPGVTAAPIDGTAASFRNLKALEIREHLENFLEMVRSVNPSVQLLLTVSPVPLTATASRSHVLRATTHSKAVLRAVAGEMAEESHGVMYFPSYDLLTSHACRGAHFNPDLRTVSDEGVRWVMSQFFEAAGLSSRGTGEPEGLAEHGSSLNTPLCDEDAIWAPVGD